MPKVTETRRGKPDRPTDWGLLTHRELLDLGIARVTEFCRRNDLEPPIINVIRREVWHLDLCAYWRPEGIKVHPRLAAEGYGPGINICPEECSRPTTQAQFRNWSWPGSVSDRTPYGVLAHETGHYLDWTVGERKETYSSEYSEAVMKESGEQPITSYAPNPAEWFAEMARLFITNPLLLRALRPRAYGILCERFSPLIPLESLFGKDTEGWRHDLGAGAPERIVNNLARRVREGK